MATIRPPRVSSEQRARRWATRLFLLAFVVLWLVAMAMGFSWWKAGLATLFGVGVNGLLLLGGPPVDQREADGEGCPVEG